MFSRRLDVEFVNGTRSSTLVLFHRPSGISPSYRRQLAALLPRGRGHDIKNSSYKFSFVDGTNEFIDVEEMVEAGNSNQVEMKNGRDVRRSQYKSLDLDIDKGVMRVNKRITVEDFEAEQSGAAASSSIKKFILKKDPRVVTNAELDWSVASVLAFYDHLKIVRSGLVNVSGGFLNWFAATAPAANPPPPVTDPLATVPDPLAPDVDAPAEGTGSGWVQNVSAPVSSVISYIMNLKRRTQSPTLNLGQTASPV